MSLDPRDERRSGSRKPLPRSIGIDTVPSVERESVGGRRWLRSRTIGIRARRIPRSSVAKIPCEVPAAARSPRAARHVAELRRRIWHSVSSRSREFRPFAPMMTAAGEERDRDQQQRPNQTAFPVAIFAHRFTFEALEPIFHSSIFRAVGFFRHEQNLRSKNASFTMRPLDSKDVRHRKKFRAVSNSQRISAIFVRA